LKGWNSSDIWGQP